jgi:uncharacterized membrane protein HdeD (DUF308 family)
MRLALVRNWWSLVLRGLLGILIGVVTFAWPGITLASLVLLFGAYALVDGIFSIAGAVRAAQSHERWVVLVIEGLVGIAAAVITVAWPAITALALVFVIGAWAVVTGAFEIAAAVRLRKHITGEWLLALSGIASVIFGLLVMIAPLAGALVIALWFGAYAFIFGILMMVLGFKLRSLRNSPFAGHPVMPAPAH